MATRMGGLDTAQGEGDPIRTPDQAVTRDP